MSWRKWGTLTIFRVRVRARFPLSINCAIVSFDINFVSVFLLSFEIIIKWIFRTLSAPRVKSPWARKSRRQSSQSLSPAQYRVYIAAALTVSDTTNNILRKTKRHKHTIKVRNLSNVSISIRESDKWAICSFVTFIRIFKKLETRNRVY